MYLITYVIFFKQKTAYELRISDWSSDVCSSYLTIIHLDVVAEEMGRTLMPALSLWGDARATLDELRGVLAGSGMQERLACWAAEVPERLVGWRRDVDSRLTSDEQPVHMPRLLPALTRTQQLAALRVAEGSIQPH